MNDGRRRPPVSPVAARGLRALGRAPVMVMLGAVALGGAALGDRALLAQSINDPTLRVDIIAQGLSLPTTMTFLSPPWAAPGEFLIEFFPVAGAVR